VAARAFPLLDVLPDPVSGVVIDRERLWRLPLAVTAAEVRSLAWHLRLPLWADGGVPRSVAPIDVLRCPARFPDQHARMLAADLAFPIDVLDRPDGPTILDGVHRLAKAWLLGMPEIAVRLLPPAQLSRITG
jgi:hypothetical protein